jgi:tetratricopeptide (TPR) repeat protein
LRIAFADPDLDLDAKMQLLLSFYEMTRADSSGTSEQQDLLERAYALIDVLKQAHPESGKPNAIHGDFLLRDGRKQEAREEFRQALVHEKDRFPIWQQLVQLDLELSDYSALHEDAVAASELFPTLPFFHLYNGIALSNLGQHDEAIEALITGRDLVVDDNAMLAQFWSGLGDAYNEAKQYDKSDDAFERAIDLDPQNPNTLNNYAYYLSIRGEKLEKAGTMSRKSNDLAPGQPSYLDTYAWVLFRMDKFTEAKQWITKAIEAGGGSEGVIVEHYGDILFRLGDAAGAMEQWKHAQQLGGASDDIDRKVREGTLAE